MNALQKQCLRDIKRILESGPRVTLSRDQLSRLIQDHANNHQRVTGPPGDDGDIIMEVIGTWISSNIVRLIDILLETQSAEALKVKLGLDWR